METKETTAQFQCGFSMAEVLVVLCGFAILAGIGVPVLNTMMSQYGTSMAAQQIATQFQNARMKAVSANEPYRVNFNQGARSYQIETANGVLHSGPFTLPAGTMFNTLDGNPITFPGSHVLFQPSGGIPLTGAGSAGRVKLINRNGTRIDVIVSSGGMVRTTPSFKTATPPY